MILLLVVCTILQSVNAAVYVGCFDRPEVLQGMVGEYIYSAENPPTVECNCANIGYDYQLSWGEYGGVGIYEWCYCTNTPPNYFYYLDPVGDTCYAGVNDEGGNINAVLLSSDVLGWTSGDCYAPSISIVGIPVTSLEQCLEHCQSQSLPYAALVVRWFNPTATCGCYATQSIWQGSPTTDCYRDDWQIFYNAVEPSHIARRRQVNMKTEEDRNICPVGTTPCLLEENGSSGFECIDTSNELESCGGCTYGQFTTNSKFRSRSSGTNCITLPGVSTNGVTCSEGKCKAFGCEDGFKLLDYSCVSEE